MTIDKAIKDIREIQALDCHIKYQEWQDALNLGIEALREVKKARFGGPTLDGELLPGETEE